MLQDLTLYLPVGPSVNTLFNNVARAGKRGKLRVPTKKYILWKTSAKTAIRMQLPDEWIAIDKPLSLLIELQRPTSNSDLSNRIKALEDSLVQNGVICDDRLVHDIRIKWKSNITLPSDLVNLTGKIARLHLKLL